MSVMLTVLQEKAQQLSPQRQSELIDFAELLLNRENATAPIPRRELAFDWVVESEAEPLPKSSSANGQIQQATPSFSRGLTFDWCDGPDDPPVEMTSVEMQHEVLEWMVQKAEEDFTSHETIA